MTEGPDQPDGVIKRQLSPQDVLDTGLLWAINRVLLHPRGYALALNGDTGQMTLWGNGDQPWEFRSPINEDEKMRAFNELLASVTKETP
jgi:hypothetical protein